MALPFPTSDSTPRDPMRAFPEQQPDALHDGAPAGLTFGADLPVESVAAMPMKLTGYSPEPTNPPAPSAADGKGGGRL